ncbi:tyrosine-type recombinase/integrase [Paraburkholderia sp. BR10936]|uniref:tyrosine-type recombinase/integrase n=1 Tax=Paraburkholderia sp. BR10936 TaxID=3236993 RepID=UPI0034D1DFE3
MALYKRDDSDVWWIDFRAPGGKRVRQTTGTTDKEKAQEYHDTVKAESWRVKKMGEKVKRTFDEAALRMLDESTHLSSCANIEIHIRHWTKIFSGRLLDSITRDEVLDGLPKFSQRTKSTTPLGIKTKNAYLGTMRHLFNLALEWEWIKSAPILKETRLANKRVRWITREEAQRLLAAISTEWLRDVAALGFATGLRRANLLGLEWSQVDLVKRQAWIHPDQAKARKAIGVPLSNDAVTIIRRWIGKHPTHVFCLRGRPVPTIASKQWNTQVRRAGLENFRFHDVRHTWASWHVQAGTPLTVLMSLGGWTKYEHVLRYAHLDTRALAEHANAVSMWAEPERLGHDLDTVADLAA